MMTNSIHVTRSNDMTKWFTRATVSALALILMLTARPSIVYAQATTTQTTLSAVVTAPGQGAPSQLVVVASATGISVGSELFVDREAMLVNAVNGTALTVQRGYDATSASAHANSSLVYAGPTSGITGSPFLYQDPRIGSCTASSLLYSLYINVVTGALWQCTASTWMNVIDGIEFVQASSCAYSTSGGTLATPTFGAAGNTALGLINASATITPVYQIATTSSGTATNTLTCQVPVPSRVNAARGSYLVDATFFYGVQQTGLGTQVAVLASGTMNGQAVFTKVALPVAAASETASTVTPVRADAGTLLITPVVASSNVATTTAGGFYSVKFTPATPIALTTDLTAYYVNATFLATASSATTINTPGMLIHYRRVGGL